MNDMHDNQAFPMSSQASPGKILHREREAMGLSLEEAATGLNLRPAVVKGLESDDYQEVPVAAYRRGYLRAYARLLGIDDAPIIKAYNSRAGETEAVQRVEPTQVSREPSPLFRWLFPLVGLLTILGLLVLAFLWWQNREPAPVEVIDTNESIAVDTLDGVTIISGEGDLPSDTSPSPATDMPSSPAVDMPETSTNTASPSAEENIAVADSASNASDIGGSGALEQKVPAQETPEQADAVAVPANTENDSTPAAAQNSQILAFTFNKESWTQVVDASGKRIFVGLQPPNTQAKVEGEPPYRLTVGNANGVELLFRGESVDLARIAGAGNVARFTLGE